MAEVIGLFRESDTLDELGIGSVRDAFSDHLFPGLSTVQTRGRYFLFVPWVYRDIERRQVPSRSAGKEARRLEIRLVHAMEAAGVEPGEGVIGWVARENLKRLPSSIYWTGLGAFRIRRFVGSQDNYHRSLDSHYRAVDAHSRERSEELAERLPRNWASLPDRPEGLFDSTSIDLGADEASFLRDQIVTTVPNSLLAHLLHDPRPEDVPFPWAHSHAALVPPALDDKVQHARRFSEVMHGAALVYNVMLARLAESRGLAAAHAEGADDYEARLSHWADRMGRLQDELALWDQHDFWQTVEQANPRIPLPTRRFIDTWVDLTRSRLDRVVDLRDDVQNLIRDREVRLKGSQARLRTPRALEKWSGESGTVPLDYRWPTAKRIIADIAEGLRRA